jgi:hypothetical protein
MRKSKITQELANGFPEWTKIRNDDQSIGKSFLNVIGLELESLFIELFRTEKNMFLTTANPGEIDQTYKLTLPNNFEFNVENVNNLSTTLDVPTISGLQFGTWFNLSPVEGGSIKKFWYEALPTRVSKVSEFQLNNHLVASGMSTLNELVLVNGTVNSNKLSIVVDGDLLIGLDSNNQLQRSSVRITGETWKGTQEQEESVFLYSECRQTFKAWDSISRIEPINFYTDSSIEVYSHQFNFPLYIDSLGSISQDVNSRENMPIFWAVSNSGGKSILDAKHYDVNKAIDLLKSKPTLSTFQSWELLNSAEQHISIVDISVVPFEQRIYAVDSSKLYIYDTFFMLPDLQKLSQRTSGSLINIETSSDYLIRDEEVEISCLFAKPIKTVIRNRVTVTYPDGASFGLLSNGSLVSTSTDYWEDGETSDRFIRQPFFLELNDLGDHLLTFECEYLDGVIDTSQRLVRVQAKIPLAVINLSSISTTITGIDIDHLGHVLVRESSGKVHQLQFHYDNVLVDFENKELIFRDKYDEVKVIK